MEKNFNLFFKNFFLVKFNLYNIREINKKIFGGFEFSTYNDENKFYKNIIWSLILLTTKKPIGKNKIIRIGKNKFKQHYFINNQSSKIFLQTFDKLRSIYFMNKVNEEKLKIERGGKKVVFLTCFNNQEFDYFINNKSTFLLSNFTLNLFFGKFFFKTNLKKVFFFNFFNVKTNI